jgi:hypothetical protein
MIKLVSPLHPLNRPAERAERFGLSTIATFFTPAAPQKRHEADVIEFCSTVTDSIMVTLSKTGLSRESALKSVIFTE